MPSFNLETALEFNCNFNNIYLFQKKPQMKKNYQNEKNVTYCILICFILIICGRLSTSIVYFG